MNWNSITVSIISSGGSQLVNDLPVNIFLLTDDDISFLITTTTDSNGIASITNSQDNSYIKQIGKSFDKTICTNTDSDFGNITTVYASVTCQEIVTNSILYVLNPFLSNLSIEIQPRSSSYNDYKYLEVVTVDSNIAPQTDVNVYSFYYDSNNLFIGKQSGITDYNATIIFNLSEIPNYQEIDIQKTKFNALNDRFILLDESIGVITGAGVSASTKLELDDNYDNYYSLHIGDVYIFDYLIYNTGNGFYVPGYTQIVLYDGNSYFHNLDFDISGFCHFNSTITGISNNSLTAYFNLSNNNYLTPEAIIDIFYYPSDGKTFYIDNLIFPLPKKSYQIKLPKISDTVLPSFNYSSAEKEIYNLPNTQISFDCKLSNNTSYTETLTSNEENITFSSSASVFSGEIRYYMDFLDRITARYKSLSTSDYASFTLSKHHYINSKSYAIIQSTITYQNGIQTCNYFFSDYDITTNVIATAVTASTSIIRDGSSAKGVVITSDYSGCAIMPLPYRKVYMKIKREAYVCPRKQELNDYIQGFSYNENYNSEYYKLRNFNLDIEGHDATNNYLYVANEEFIKKTYSEVEIESETYNVQDYKKQFVNEYLKKEGRYLTEYVKNDTNNTSYDDEFSETTNHAFVFDFPKYTFYPKTENTYLRFEKIYSNGNATVTLVKIGQQETINDLQYRTGNYEWNDYTIEQTLEIPDDKYVEFRRKTNTNTFSNTYQNPDLNHYCFRLNAENSQKIKVSGNISSLLNPSANGITVSAASNGVFSYLFSEQTALEDASDLNLDIIKVPGNGYDSMFLNCTSLKSGPQIYAYSGNGWCFQNMFNGCSLMDTGPKKIFLENYHTYACYRMFYNCSKLKNGPEISRSYTGKTSFSSSCFQEMFYSCTEMTKLGDNTTFLGGLYQDDNNNDYSSYVWQNAFKSMFENCISLTASPIFEPYYIGPHGCMKMFYNCKSLTETYFNFIGSGDVMQSGCYSMYEGCESLHWLSGITLNATNLSPHAYERMFYGCRNIGGFFGGKTIEDESECAKLPIILATEIPNSGCKQMYSHCFGNPNNKNFLNQFITEDLTSVGPSGMCQMFEYCDYLDIYPIERQIKYNSHTITIKDSLADCHTMYDAYLEDLPNYSYDYPKKLKVIRYFSAGQPIPFDIGYYSNYNGNIQNVESYFALTNGGSCDYYNYYVKLSASTLNDYCYGYMFSHCPKLHYAHHIILPAKELSPYSYVGMFEYCDELFSIPILSAVTSISECSMSGMFLSCSSCMPNNARGLWWVQPHWFSDEWEYVNNHNNLSPVQWGKDNNYYTCKKGLYSIQKDYLYTFNTDGRFEWQAIYDKNSDENNYMLFNISGDVISAHSMAYLLAYTSTADSMTYNNFIMNIDHFYGTSGLTNMFYDCKGLTYSFFKLFSKVNTIPSYTFASMFENNYSLKHGFRFGFKLGNSQLERTTVNSHGCHKMFKNCFEAFEPFVENTCGYTNTLMAKTIDDYAYANMYDSCYKMKFGPGIYATALGNGCCQHMFKECWRLSGITGNILPSTTLSETCYYGMFENCHLLHNAPGLPAQNIPSSAYSYMFAGAALRYYCGYLDFRYDAQIMSGDPNNNPFIPDLSKYTPEPENTTDTLSNRPIKSSYYGTDFYKNFYFNGCTSFGWAFQASPSSVVWGLWGNVFLLSKNLSEIFPVEQKWENPFYLNSGGTPIRYDSNVNFNSNLYLYENEKPEGFGYSNYLAISGIVYNDFSAESTNILSNVHYTKYQTKSSYVIVNGFDIWDNWLYTIASEASTPFIYEETTNCESFDEMYNDDIAGELSKFIKYSESQPSGYKPVRYNNNNQYDPNGSHILNNYYVNNKVEKYKTREHYRVTNIRQDDQQYYETVNEGNTTPPPWTDEIFKTPSDLRDGEFGKLLEMVFNQNKNHDVFTIPLNNDWYTGVCACSLSQIVTSANTLNETVSKGWVEGLKFVDGDFYCKSNSNIPTNSTNGCPDNWQKHTN